MFLLIHIFNNIITHFREQCKINYSLILIIGIIILLSSTFMLRYDTESSIEQQEKLIFAEFLTNNLSGKVLDSGNTLQGITYSNLSDNNSTFKNMGLDGEFKNMFKNDKLKQINLSGISLEDFILNAQNHELKYISINGDGVTEIWYPYLGEVFQNENEYKFFKKVVDSKDLGLKQFSAKVFEIEYEKFFHNKP